MLEDTIILKQIWQELKEKGAKETEDKETIPTGYITQEYKIIKYQGLEFEIRMDNNYQYLFDELEKDNEVFLVNYHRDFWETKDNIITEEETAELYRGERNWRKTEKEKGYWIFELSCLVHSGVWLNFGGDGFMSDPQGWDTSRVGLVLVSKKIARTEKKAQEIGKKLVDTWNKLLSGDVYEITIKKDGEEIDRIGGIIGETEVYKFIKDYKV
jgi:hypothetical protein